MSKLDRYTLDTKGRPGMKLDPEGDWVQIWDAEKALESRDRAIEAALATFDTGDYFNAAAIREAFRASLERTSK
jgi:hypothetical protein